MPLKGIIRPVTLNTDKISGTAGKQKLHRSSLRLLLSSDPVFFLIYHIDLCLSFHLASQKSGRRRSQLHLCLAKLLLRLSSEKNDRPDRISLA